MGGKRIRGLKMRVGCKCCIGRRGPDCAMKVYQMEESEEKGTVLVSVESPKKAGRTAPGVRSAKSSESRKGECSEHFK